MKLPGLCEFQTKVLPVALSAIFLYGCGEGGSSTVSVDTPDNSGTPTTPVTDTPDLATDCEGSDLINIISASSTSNTSTTFTAANAADDNLEEASRWETSISEAAINLDMGQRYLVREVGIAWYQGDQQTANFNLASSEDGETFSSIAEGMVSSGSTQQLERYDIDDTAGQYLQITTNLSNSTDNAIIEVIPFGCALDEDAPIEEGNFDLSALDLDPSVPPGSNFDLLTWAMDTPEVDPSDGLATRVSERELDEGYEDQYFFTGEDGGMVFRTDIYGARTSANTSYARTELREMLRRGNTSISTQGTNRNNWILGYQPDPGVTVGGRNGHLKATLAVNHVTTTGEDFQIGRVIIGQIHADDDEPIRLYYRKFLGSERGIIYLAHEIRGGDDLYIVVVGPEDTSPENQPRDAVDPANGILLDEVFSYEIIQDGARIDVYVRRGALDGPIIGHSFIDMEAENSGYDIVDEWMYFKAGAYSQNNSGDTGEYDQVTFYVLENTHDAQ